MEGLGFYLSGAVTLLGALMMVSRRNPIHSVLWLVVAFLGLAGLFGGMDAHFLAAVQILVYAGAILVLFLFVIMLLNLRPDDLSRTPGISFEGWFGGLVVGVLGFAIVVTLVVQGSPALEGAVVADLEPLEAGPMAVAVPLFDRWLLPFEAVSLLLLAAIVGAVALTKRRLD